MEIVVLEASRKLAMVTLELEIGVINDEGNWQVRRP